MGPLRRAEVPRPSPEGCFHGWRFHDLRTRREIYSQRRDPVSTAGERVENHGREIWRSLPAMVVLGDSPQRYGPLRLGYSSLVAHRQQRQLRLSRGLESCAIVCTRRWTWEDYWKSSR